MRGLRFWSITAVLLAVIAVLFVAVPGPARAYLAQDAPPNDFAFAILGDRTGGAQMQVYERIWREIDLRHPNFVMTVGDTIEGGSDATAEAEWRQLRPLWSKRRYPVYFTPGNHDIWSDASRRIYESETHRPAHYSFSYQNAHFSVLDNSGSFELNASQMQFLAADLERNKNREPKFVFFHQPFWLLPLKLQNTDFPFHQLVRKYHVNYVVSAHVHQFSRMERDGIVYMVVGSSGGRLRGNDPFKDFSRGWFYHHVWVTLTGSKIEATVKEIDAPMGKGRTFRAGDWGEYGPKFNPDR